jgi:hypothetical protein
MSGGIAPQGESADEPPHGFGGGRTRVWPRLGYALALVWVVVGLVLFLIEVAGLVAGRG